MSAELIAICVSQDEKLHLSSKSFLEFVRTAIAVCLIALTDRLVTWSIGERKFFGVIPVSWVFDLSHLVVVGRLIWRVMKTYNQEDE